MTAALTHFYLDSFLGVFYKPSGLLSVPGKDLTLPSMQKKIEQEFGKALVVHRLDCDTSGLMVFAFDALALKLLHQQFRERQIKKIYQAQAYLTKPLQAHQGLIDLPLIADWPNRPLQKVDFRQGKNAITHWQSEAPAAANHIVHFTLSPITGRSHQLRLHLAAMGWPIIGDRFYAPLDVQNLNSRLLLQATELFFQHPITDEQLHIECPRDF